MQLAVVCPPWRHNRDMPSAITQLLAPHGPVVAAIRARFPNAMAVYAFGSQVQGTAGSDSDLDLAVLVAGYAAPLAMSVRDKGPETPPPAPQLHPIFPSKVLEASHLPHVKGRGQEAGELKRAPRKKDRR